MSTSTPSRGRVTAFRLITLLFLVLMGLAVMRIRESRKSKEVAEIAPAVLAEVSEPAVPTPVENSIPESAPKAPSSNRVSFRLTFVPEGN